MRVRASRTGWQARGVLVAVCLWSWPTSAQSNAPSHGAQGKESADPALAAAEGRALAAEQRAEAAEQRAMAAEAEVVAAKDAQASLLESVERLEQQQAAQAAELATLSEELATTTTTADAGLMSPGVGVCQLAWRTCGCTGGEIACVCMAGGMFMSSAA